MTVFIRKISKGSGKELSRTIKVFSHIAISYVKKIAKVCILQLITMTSLKIGTHPSILICVLPPSPSKWECDYAFV